MRADDVQIVTADGSRLHGWFLPAVGKAKGTVLHLHGNAANVSNHLPLVAWLPARGYNVLMVDYRGFGRSQGKPSLDGIVDDAAAALAYLRTRTDIDQTRLIVLGQSIGGATALRLLARDANGVRLAVIDSAFASYRGIARDATAGGPLAPVAALTTGLLPGPDKDPITALKSIDVPLIFVHGKRDSIIDAVNSERLHAAAAGSQHWTRAGCDAHHGACAARIMAREAGADDGRSSALMQLAQIAGMSQRVTSGLRPDGQSVRLFADGNFRDVAGSGIDRVDNIVESPR